MYVEDWGTVPRPGDWFKARDNMGDTYYFRMDHHGYMLGVPTYNPPVPTVDAVVDVATPRTALRRVTKAAAHRPGSEGWRDSIHRPSERMEYLEGI